MDSRCHPACRITKKRPLKRCKGAHPQAHRLPHGGMEPPARSPSCTDRRLSLHPGRIRFPSSRELMTGVLYNRGDGFARGKRKSEYPSIKLYPQRRANRPRTILHKGIAERAIRKHIGCEGLGKAGGAQPPPACGSAVCRFIEAVGGSALRLRIGSACEKVIVTTPGADNKKEL